MPDELDQLKRIARQRLESLRRAGVDFLPNSKVVIAPTKRIRPVDQAPSLVEETPPQIIPRPTPRPVVIGPVVVPMMAASLFEEPALEGSPIPTMERPGQLEALRIEVSACVRCPLLAETRTQTVFGEGSSTARVMFIGEAPGAEEDRTGRPFIGPAGQLLTDMITKGMGLTREEVYIANILKSRPPENRDPLSDEMKHCLPYLERQLAIIRPEFLCLLGRIAAQALLDTAIPLGRLRGKWHKVRGIPALVTYHPSYLLRNPAAKKDAWQDLQILMQAMGISPPRRTK